MSIKIEKNKTIELFPHMLVLEEPLPNGPFGPELSWWKDGWQIIGTDEAGRGPWAGPVVAGAVLFDSSVELHGINDSKVISAKKREVLAEEIRKKAIAFSVAAIDHNRIDKINILQASREAMLQAVNNILANHSLAQLGLFVDGRIPTLGIGQQVNLIKGDSVSFSVGAASILAKVERDRIMVEYEKDFPEYGFAKHKGYITAQHLEAAIKHGLSPIHRRSFHVRAYEKAIK